MPNPVPDARPSVRVHIEELVLCGFAPAERYRITDAVQSGLQHLFAEQGVPAPLRPGGQADRLTAAPIRVSPAMRAETVGAQVARSVYGSLNLTLNPSEPRSGK